MTFSIVARSRDGAYVAVATASRSLAVGAAVTAAAPGAGALATQAFTNRAYRGRGLALLREGRSPAEVVALLTDVDGGSERRQVAVVDAVGRSTAWTGTGCTAWAGHETGPGWAVAANYVTGPEVVRQMVAAVDPGVVGAAPGASGTPGAPATIRHGAGVPGATGARGVGEPGAGPPGVTGATTGVRSDVGAAEGRPESVAPAGRDRAAVHLAEHLLDVLRAGENAGGDRRGRQSAAVYVVRADGPAHVLPPAALVDLRVDDHPQPLDELARLLGLRLLED